MTSNAELHARRQAAIPRGVSNSLAVYAERAAQRRDLGRRGQALHRLRQRHLGAQHRARASEGEGRDRAAAREAHARLLPGDAVRELRAARRAAERSSRRAPRPRRPSSSPPARRRWRTPSRSRASTPSARRSSRSRAGFTAARSPASALTGKVQPYKAGFGPMLPEVFHVPYPMAYHGVTRGGLARGASSSCSRPTSIRRASRRSSSSRCWAKAGSTPRPAELLRQAAQRCATSTASC